MTLYHIFLWFLFYSFIGWVFESTYSSIHDKKLLNRGFLSGPICPIYGAGAIVFLLTLQWIESPFLIFLVGMVSASVLEYITSAALERVFHARFWDYSNFRLHIKGRVCLWASLVFGAFAVLLIKWLHPQVLLFTLGIPKDVIVSASFFFGLLLFLDCAVTVSRLLRFTHRLAEVQATINAFFRAGQSQTTLSAKKPRENPSAELPPYPHGEPVVIKRPMQERQVLTAYPKTKTVLAGDAHRRGKPILPLDRHGEENNRR